ncbi:hypothetical protein D3C80_1691840 [compost metagenome]
MHQHGIPRVPGRVEVRQPFGGQVEFDTNIGDDEAALVGGPFQLQAKKAAQAGARTVGGNDPGAFQRVGAGWRVHLQPSMIACLAHIDHLVAPAQLDQGVGLGGQYQLMFQARLLQVGHGREAVVVIVGRLHAKHPLVAVERIAEAPGQPSLSDAVRHTDLLQNLQ